MNKYQFRIGPATISVESENALSAVQVLYQKFEMKEQNSIDLTIRLRDDPPPSVTDKSYQGEVENNWKLYKDEQRFYFEVYQQIASKRKMLFSINHEWNEADLFFDSNGTVPSSQRGFRIGEVFVPFLQWWLTSWLALQKRGMIVHGSAVSFGNSALAFVGPSGAGKTTIARICRDNGSKTVLNDERIIIWRNDHEWQVSGTPWPGMLYEAAQMTQPLACLCLLTKAETNQFKILSTEDVFSRFFPEAFFPIWDEERTAGLVEAAKQFIQEVPCGDLSFRKDASIVGYLEELVTHPSNF